MDEAPRVARVLVVEDDARIAAFLVRGLQAMRFAPTWVETGGAAIEEVEHRSVDVVLLDLGLPDIDGLEVLERWRRDERSIPVVVLTARSDPRDRARANELGIEGYLTKPAPFATVVDTLRSAVVGLASDFSANG